MIALKSIHCCCCFMFIINLSFNSIEVCASIKMLESCYLLLQTINYFIILLLSEIKPMENLVLMAECRDVNIFLINF